MEAGHGYKVRRGVGREFRAILFISDILYHPWSNKPLSRFTGYFNYHIICN